MSRCRTAVVTAGAEGFRVGVKGYMAFDEALQALLGGLKDGDLRAPPGALGRVAIRGG